MYVHNVCDNKQASQWFILGSRTWRCWRPPSLVLRVSSETVSLLCKRPRTGVSAPLSILGGATTRFRVSTLTLHGNLNPWTTKCLSFAFHKRSLDQENDKMDEKTLNSNKWDWHQKVNLIPILVGNVWRRQLLRSLLVHTVVDSTHLLCRRPSMTHRFWSWTEFLRYAYIQIMEINTLIITKHYRCYIVKICHSRCLRHIFYTWKLTS